MPSWRTPFLRQAVCPPQATSDTQAFTSFNRPDGLARGVEPPLAGEALELPGAALLELDARAGDEVLDRLRYEHLSRACLGRDAGAGVHRDSAHVAACEHDLAGVEAGSNVQSDPVDVVDDRARTANGA